MFTTTKSSTFSNLLRFPRPIASSSTASTSRMILGSKASYQDGRSAEGAENGLEFTIVRPFDWIGRRMDFILGVDGLSEGVLRVLACCSNNLLNITLGLA